MTATTASVPRSSTLAQLRYFFDQTLWLLFFALFVIIQLLLEGDYYLRLAFISLESRQIAKTADMQTIQLGQIDAGSSSLSVLLSAVETRLRTRTALEIAH